MGGKPGPRKAAGQNRGYFLLIVSDRGVSSAFTGRVYRNGVENSTSMRIAASILDTSRTSIKPARLIHSIRRSVKDARITFSTGLRCCTIVIPWGELYTSSGVYTSSDDMPGSGGDINGAHALPSRNPTRLHSRAGA